MLTTKQSVLLNSKFGIRGPQNQRFDCSQGDYECLCFHTSLVSGILENNQ